MKRRFPKEEHLGIQCLAFVEDLDPLNPVLTYEEETRALLAIYFQTGGSREGFAIADAWSRRGENYIGLDGTMMTWNLFDSMREGPLNDVGLVARFEEFKKDD